MGHEKNLMELWPTSGRVVARRGREGGETSLLLLGLRLPGRLDTSQEVGSGDAEGIANSVEKVNRGRLLVVFQEGDVGTVNASRIRKLFLR